MPSPDDVLAVVAGCPKQPFIAGEFCPGKGGAAVTLNPADGRPLAEVSTCAEPDVDEAVRAARAAFDSGIWSDATVGDRQHVLLRIAELVDERAVEFALLDCLDAGKPLAACRGGDVPTAVRCFRWYGGLIDKVYGLVAPTGPDVSATVTRQPVGVVAAIIPWNYPFSILAGKAAPALAAGNSVILKPSELTPLSALAFARVAGEAGIPPGVLQILPGEGPPVGGALGRHPGVDMVSFTGSAEVARELIVSAARSNLKEVVAECGGKGPQVVFADAAPILGRVVDSLLAALLTNSGQNCTCGSRILAHDSVKEELTERLVSGLGHWLVGDPLDPSTRLGPLISESHLHRVTGFIAEAKGDGAEVVTGGERTLTETGGWYLEPTLLDSVPENSRAWREEIFGPVGAIAGFSDEAEAIAMANRTPYGLAASVYTTDPATAHRASRALAAGTVSINCYSEGDLTTPFGGWKESGFGGSEKGFEALRIYTRLKTVWQEFPSAPQHERPQ